MSLFQGKDNINGGENLNDFAQELLPLIDDAPNNTVKQEPHTQEKDNGASVNAKGRAKQKAASDIILTSMGSSDPLQSLKNTVKQTVQQADTQQPLHHQTFAPKKSEEDEFTFVLANKKEKNGRKAKKTSSLLAKCMPYIYDDQGNNYAEEKPDYTLESVEDIIESAEKRANEKIARMYNLKTDEIERIGNEEERVEQPNPKIKEKVKLRVQETSVKRPLKIGDAAKGSARAFDTVSIPKVSATLFDDFSGRRTDVMGEENITVPYSAQGGMDANDSGGTKIIPTIKAKAHKQDVFEDIVSQTKHVNVQDISSSSGKKPVLRVTNNYEEDIDIPVEEFRGAKDIHRVGSMLKRDAFTAKIRMMATLLLTLVAAIINLPSVTGVADPGVLGVIALIVFALATLTNANIFGGFRGAFTQKSRIELPLALATTLMLAYFVYSIIMGNYPAEPIFLPMASLLVYDWCAYRKGAAIFDGFKIAASRKSKKAVCLIDDPAVTTAMARSVITGEVLAAGEQETDEVDDFLKNSFKDRPFLGKVNIFSGVMLAAAVFVGLSIGVSFSSFADGLLATATVLFLGAAPSLFVADMLPFAGISAKLFRLRGVLCSKASAEQIEQVNAVVISSEELFPKGCIRLYNMTPLGANPLDETIVLSAAVAKEAKSPLYPMLSKILTGESLLPQADSVKYEENLGVSGWVGNKHIMIGNRSLMEAHGVRVPALEVDRKILHKGFFPVYIACDQRACALLTVGYSVDREIGTELGRLCNKGVTLLVKNCDPNINEQMLCDYYALYPDLVKVLDHNGSNKYTKSTEPCGRVSAHGFHRGDLLSFLSIITGSMRLRTLSGVLSVMHIIAAVVMWLLFTVMSLGGSMTLMSSVICVLCELVALIVSLTAYFVGK